MGAGGRLGGDPGGARVRPPTHRRRRPSDVTTGPDGNLWYLKVDDAPFPDPTKDLVGRITPAGVVTQSSLGPDRDPLGITAGPDGNVWFTEEVPPFVTRVTPTTPLVVTDFITLTGRRPQRNHRRP